MRAPRAVLSVLHRLRDAGNRTPVLLLSARGEVNERVAGLDAGADDYLVKPFELEELAARIRALSRRSPDTKGTVLTHGSLQMNLSDRTISYESNTINLTPKEYMILECFLHKPNQVFPRSVLLDKLWELDRSVGENTIKTHITNLRQKLKIAGCTGDVIETVYGVGYRLCQL